MLSRARLLELFLYDPETGVLRWRDNMSPTARKDDIAGHVWTNQDGIRYRVVEINRKNHGVHRVIWCMQTGEWPKLIDHKDRDGLNNRWVNLRKASWGQNQQNKKIHRNNTSGCKGVSYRKDSGKWVAYIGANSEKIHLGFFPTLELAKEFRDLAADMLHGEFARAA